jgi:hypothetical protein
MELQDIDGVPVASAQVVGLLAQLRPEKQDLIKINLDSTCSRIDTVNFDHIR